MESVASTLDFVRKQSAARRSDYNERWKVDVDVNLDASTDADDDDKRTLAMAPLMSAPQVAPRPLMEADNPLSCIGDHKYEYAVSPTTRGTTRGKHQRCVVEYYPPPGNVASATDFTIGSRERSVS